MLVRVVLGARPESDLNRVDGGFIHLLKPIYNRDENGRLCGPRAADVSDFSVAG